MTGCALAELDLGETAPAVVEDQTPAASEPPPQEPVSTEPASEGKSKELLSDDISITDQISNSSIEASPPTPSGQPKDEDHSSLHNLLSQTLKALNIT